MRFKDCTFICWLGDGNWLYDQVRGKLHELGDLVIEAKKKEDKWKFFGQLEVVVPEGRNFKLDDRFVNFGDADPRMILSVDHIMHRLSEQKFYWAERVSQVQAQIGYANERANSYQGLIDWVMIDYN